MKILGISAYYHDSAAAITLDGHVIACAQEEWFTRLKHDSSFPHHAVRWCLEYAGLEITDLDGIAFYDKPFLKFERLLETYYSFAPKGLKSFISSMPVWVKEKLFLKSKIRKELLHLFPDAEIPELFFPEHHLSHAASAFYPSPFAEAAILTVDGVGEWATASICYGDNDQIKVIKEMHFPHSIGLLYSAFTYYLGFKVNFGEYKLMGLAPYGNIKDDQTKVFIEKIKSHLIQIYEDGSIWLNQKYFRYATSNRMIHQQKWEQLFDLPLRKPEAKFEQVHCNMAMAIQKVTEEVMIKMARHVAQITGSKNLCLAGGVALNCVANGKLLEEGIFDEIWIQPAAGDAGGSLGAALAVEFQDEDAKRKPRTTLFHDEMNGAYLGPEYSNDVVEKTAKKYKANFHYFDDDQLFKQIAEEIENGKVIGWFQGRQEFGPRALGNRSILGDPRSPEMQSKLNLKIKFRESFRPFAPSVLSEQKKHYFQLKTESPYMLLVAPVTQNIRLELPKDYDQKELLNKLKTPRSTLPAITHVDFSARVQTVHYQTNPRYHALISAFFQRTQCPVLINTSFNVRGEPVVCSPADAYRCFLKTGMDILVMNNFVFYKGEQDNHKLIRQVKEEKFLLD